VQHYLFWAYFPRIDTIQASVSGCTGTDCGTATNSWVYPTSTLGSSTGGGQFTPIGPPAEDIVYGFAAHSEPNGEIKGKCLLNDDNADVMFKCLDVTVYVESGPHSFFYGTCRQRRLPDVPHGVRRRRRGPVMRSSCTTWSVPLASSAFGGVSSVTSRHAVAPSAVPTRRNAGGPCWLFVASVAQAVTSVAASRAAAGIMFLCTAENSGCPSAISGLAMKRS
jgi:hypothetical protein